MFSLRELDPEEIVSATKFATWIYSLLEAVVEAVEPEDAPCAEVGDWAEAQATIRKLREELAATNNAMGDEWVACATARRELAKVKEERGTLRGTLRDVRRELTEAQAEIERLRKERDAYRGDLGKELIRRDDLIRGKVEACNAQESMRADAEIGRLVRGMRKHTALVKTESTYWGQAGELKTTTEWTTADHPWFLTDPAEALRSIQEVDDDEAPRQTLDNSEETC